MEEWKKATLILCLYGFFKEIRPSEPYLTEYLVGNTTGVTESQVYHEVYPVWTYSYLAVLVLVFLFTDFLKYKAVIVFEGLSYIATWVLLLWGKGLPAMQLMQVCYGIATSTEVAYYSYIYAKVSGHYYQQVTGFTRATLLVGKFISGTIAQVLISTNLATYRDLNIISLAMVTAAAVSSVFLPSVNKTVYFHRATADSEEGGLTTNNSAPQSQQSLWGGILKSFRLIYTDCVKSMRKPYVLKWSLWWAVSMCGNFQVGNYIQPLWLEVLKSTKGETEASEHYNGAVEAATTLAGAFLAFIMGFMHFNWSLIGETTIAVIAVFDGIVLYLMAEAESIWVAYVGYLLFRSLFQMMITVASFEVASHIAQDCYGVVFGFNTFMALVFQTILTTVVASSSGLALPARDQFFVYAGYFYVVGCLFLVVGMIGWCRDGRQRFREEGIWVRPERRGSTTSTRIDPPVGSTETPQ